MYKIKYQNSNTFYVDENGSRAIVHGYFFIDGIKANEGQYTLETENGIITINVDKEGKVIE